MESNNTLVFENKICGSVYLKQNDNLVFIFYKTWLKNEKENAYISDPFNLVSQIYFPPSVRFLPLLLTMSFPFHQNCACLSAINPDSTSVALLNMLAQQTTSIFVILSLTFAAL